GPFALGERNDVVVESGNLDLAPIVDQGREHLDKCVGRIRNPAAKGAGVQILLGAFQTELVVGDAPQAVGNGRLPGGELAGVANDDDVAGQPLAIGLDERVEI